MEKDLSIEDIDKILEFFPYFKDKGNVFYTIDKEDIFYPHRYSLMVQKFLSVLHRESIVYPFDWVSWQDQALEYYNKPELLKNADMLTIRKIITLHLRKERFCDGHFISIIESGHLLKILERLKEIRKEVQTGS